jgi:hypothetical protein
MNSPLLDKAYKEYAGNNRITSVAMQRAVNTTEEGVFSMDPSRDYISSQS